LILQPMKATPSITSTGNLNGFSKVYPVRVSPFQRDILPPPAFEKQMTVNESMPITKSFRKSTNFLNYKPNRVSGRSRVRSVYPSPIMKKNFLKSQIGSSYIDTFNGAKTSLVSTDTEIYGGPLLQAWREVKPVSAKVSYEFMSDAEILSEPSMPVNQSNNSWLVRERPLQHFETIENEWPSNFNARRSTLSKVVKGPIQEGISDWINIGQELV